jgi:hypothetical protein
MKLNIKFEKSFIVVSGLGWPPRSVYRRRDSHLPSRVCIVEHKRIAVAPRVCPHPVHMSAIDFRDAVLCLHYVQRPRRRLSWRSGASAAVDTQLPALLQNTQEFPTV